MAHSCQACRPGVGITPAAEGWLLLRPSSWVVGWLAAWRRGGGAGGARTGRRLPDNGCP